MITTKLSHCNGLVRHPLADFKGRKKRKWIAAVYDKDTNGFIDRFFFTEVKSGLFLPPKDIPLEPGLCIEISTPYGVKERPLHMITAIEDDSLVLCCISPEELPRRDL